MYCLAVFDLLFSGVIVTPLVVLFWVPLWELMQRKPDWFPLFWSLYVSCTILTTVAITREACAETIRDTLTAKCLTRVYVYISAVTGIWHWRTLWALGDNFLPINWTIYGLIGSLAILAGLNGLKNLLSAPFLVQADGSTKEFYPFPTLFNVPSTERTWFYLLDCVLSVCFIGTLVVFVWRGVWCLLDIYLYPGYPSKSALASISIGYAIVVLVFALQPPMKYLARTYKGIPRLIVVDAYQLLSFLGTLNVWRGVWMALNTHFLPEKPGLSYFVTHSLSFVLLVLINSSNSLLVRGVYIDGEENGEMCVDLPCYYIRLYFQTRRKKKHIKASRKSKQQGRAEEETFCLEPGQRDTQIVDNIRRNSSLETA